MNDDLLIYATKQIAKLNAQLEAERKKVRVLREVVSRGYHNEFESRSEWDRMAEKALATTEDV